MKLTSSQTQPANCEPPYGCSSVFMRGYIFFISAGLRSCEVTRLERGLRLIARAIHPSSIHPPCLAAMALYRQTISYNCTVMARVILRTELLLKIVSHLFSCSEARMNRALGGVGIQDWPFIRTIFLNLVKIFAKSCVGTGRDDHPATRARGWLPAVYCNCSTVGAICPDPRLGYCGKPPWLQKPL